MYGNDSTVEKLKGMDEEQILKFLKTRVDFYKKENQAELDKAEADKEKLRLRKEEKIKFVHLLRKIGKNCRCSSQI